MQRIEDMKLAIAEYISNHCINSETYETYTYELAEINFKTVSYIVWNKMGHTSFCCVILHFLYSQYLHQ